MYDCHCWVFFFLTITILTFSGVLNNYTYYRPQTKLRKGNVFTSVCQEFCPQEGGGVHPQTDLPPGRHPPGKTPPAPSRRLLLRTLRILLECILVFASVYSLGVGPSRVQ